MPIFGVILVCVLPEFSRIWTEYGEIRFVFSPNAGNAGKMRTRITPNTDTFYAGLISQEKSIIDVYKVLDTPMNKVVACLTKPHNSSNGFLAVKYSEQFHYHRLKSDPKS